MHFQYDWLAIFHVAEGWQEYQIALPY